jgi:drug/metabolite transporter (DMT)-like permease
MSRSDHRLGLVQVSTAAAAWSAGGLLTRLIHVDTWTMIAWRGLAGAAGLAVVLAVRKELTWRSIAGLGLIGWLFVAQSAAGMVFYVSALRHTTVASVAVIYATAPFMAAALGFLIMRERPSASSTAASLAALGGVAAMVGFGGAGSFEGDLYAIGMTLSMAIATVVARHSKSLPILLTACLSSLLSSLLAWPLRGPLGPGKQDLGLLALFGVVNFALGVPLFTAGAKKLPAIETALLGSLEAPLAPLWVWLALGEIPGSSTLIGGSIVFAAVGIHLVVNESRQRTPADAAARAGQAADHLH